MQMLTLIFLPLQQCLLRAPTSHINHKTVGRVRMAMLLLQFPGGSGNAQLKEERACRSEENLLFLGNMIQKALLKDAAFTSL